VGTKNLLECAAACPSVQAFIYTSSDSALVPKTGVLTEDDVEAYTLESTATPYQRTKGHADTSVLSSNSENLKTARLRMGTMFSENDPCYIAGALDQLAKGQHKTQLGTNKLRRESVYVESAAHAHIAAAKSLPARKPGVAGEAFFISDNEPMPLYDLNCNIWHAAGDRADWAKEVTVVPFWLVMAVAGVWEWEFWVSVLGRREPEIRRDVLAYMERLCVFRSRRPGRR